MGRKTQKARGASGTSELNHLDVLSSVASLYADELKPVSRILRKRLLERTNANTFCIDQLRSCCEACPLLKVEPCGTSDWVALLLDREQNFVDIASTHDLYPPALWRSLSTFWTGPGKSMCLPGGRYAFGQALQQMNLSCLEGRSFGEVCHIVQIALTQKKLLGYHDGCIGPYTSSEIKCKESCAQRQQPCVTPSKSAQAVLPVASWEEAKACLQEMLRRSGGKVALANVKRMFHSQFSLELSETAFGHARVSDLLRDPRLQDLCSLELQSNGYMVVQVTTAREGALTSDRSDTIVATTSAAQNLMTEKLTPSNATQNPMTEKLTPQIIAEGPLRVHCEHCSGAPLSAKDVKVLSDDKPVLLLPTPTRKTIDTPGDVFKGTRWSLSSIVVEEGRAAKKEQQQVGPLLPRDADAAPVNDDPSKWAVNNAVDPIKFIWNHAWAGWSDYSWGDQLLCSGEVDAAEAIWSADGPINFGEVDAAPAVHLTCGSGVFGDPLGLYNSEGCFGQADKVNVNHGRGTMLAVLAAQLQNKHEPTKLQKVSTDDDLGLMPAMSGLLTSVADASDQLRLLTQPFLALPPPGLPAPQGIDAAETSTDDVWQQSVSSSFLSTFSNLFSGHYDQALVEYPALSSQAIAELGA